MKTLSITLPEQTNETEVRMIIAAALFEKGITSSGQSSTLAGISKREFIERVGAFGVSIFGESHLLYNF